MSQPRTKTIQAEPPALLLDDLRKKHPHVQSDDEFLLRAVMPGEEVDAMLEADQGDPHYNPDARPIISLLEGLRDRPALSELIIDKPGFRLELRKTSAPATTE